MNLERIGNAQGYVESPRERERYGAALDRLVASAKRSGDWTEFGEYIARVQASIVDDSPENIARIVAHDVAVNWPRIEEERRGRS